MKSITITLSDQQQLNMTASEPLDFLTTTDLLLSALLAMMESTVEAAPPQHKLDVKEVLFESFNVAASTLLAQFAPHIELRPDITEEAILKAELDLAPNYLNKTKANERS